ncbi:DUF2497 domain-containing protein [Benzoatithermus flavus]|uniref:DUF2497 domain-containing protein n=1 Tax=Benzoatithermus flavus TaxID=3108223 RepID=A0ABU8XM99_9PROT
MAESKPGQEPSMEEILSSIRRIIAEDDPAIDQRPIPQQAKGPAALSSVTAPAEDDDILELTQVVSGPATKATDPARPTAPPPVSAVQPQAPSTTVASLRSPAPTKETSTMPADAADSLISPVAASASAQALARLAKAVTTDEKKPASPLGSLTVEQMLVDLLTPMLREWLDRNLPEIVERVVEQEVKKLARRAELM